MVLPPLVRRPGGPKKSRTRGETESPKGQKLVGVRCGICRKVRHNSRTCKSKANAAPSSSASKRKTIEIGSTSHSVRQSDIPRSSTSITTQLRAQPNGKRQNHNGEATPSSSAVQNTSTVQRTAN